MAQANMKVSLDVTQLEGVVDLVKRVVTLAAEKNDAMTPLEQAGTALAEHLAGAMIASPEARRRSIKVKLEGDDVLKPQLPQEPANSSEWRESVERERAEREQG